MADGGDGFVGRCDGVGLAESAAPREARLSEFIDPALAFPSSRWNIYNNDNLARNRTALEWPLRSR